MILMQIKLNAIHVIDLSKTRGRFLLLIIDCGTHCTLQPFEIIIVKKAIISFILKDLDNASKRLD